MIYYVNTICSKIMKAVSRIQMRLRKKLGVPPFVFQTGILVYSKLLKDTVKCGFVP